MTQEELDAIRARVDAATAIIAEWGEKARYVGETEDAIPLYVDRRLSRAERFALYHFQLHAYEDIPALLAAVDRLRARIVEFETQLQPNRPNQQNGSIARPAVFYDTQGGSNGVGADKHIWRPRPRSRAD